MSFGSSQLRMKGNVKPHPRFLPEPDCGAFEPSVKPWLWAKMLLQQGAWRILGYTFPALEFYSNLISHEHTTTCSFISEG